VLASLLLQHSTINLLCVLHDIKQHSFCEASLLVFTLLSFSFLRTEALPRSFSASFRRVSAYETTRSSPSRPSVFVCRSPPSQPKSSTSR